MESSSSSSSDVVPLRTELIENHRASSNQLSTPDDHVPTLPQSSDPAPATFQARSNWHWVIKWLGLMVNTVLAVVRYTYLAELEADGDR
jgi:hypothetical protein